MSDHKKICEPHVAHSLHQQRRSFGHSWGYRIMGTYPMVFPFEDIKIAIVIIISIATWMCFGMTEMIKLYRKSGFVRKFPIIPSLDIVC